MWKLIIQVAVSALVAKLGENRSIGYLPSFIICLLFTPVVGLIVILLSKKVDGIGTKKSNRYEYEVRNGIFISLPYYMSISSSDEDSPLMRATFQAERTGAILDIYSNRGGNRPGLDNLNSRVAFITLLDLDSPQEDTFKNIFDPVSNWKWYKPEKLDVNGHVAKHIHFTFFKKGANWIVRSFAIKAPAGDTLVFCYLSTGDDIEYYENEILVKTMLSLRMEA